MMRTRLMATVTGRPAELRTKHYSGLPPEVTDDGQDTRTMMPWPAILLINEEDSGVFLYRFTADGEYAGDTWHQSLDDAKHQAEFEFAPHYSEWIAVPRDVEDPLAYAVGRKGERT